jgi:hypothetical protein
MGEVDATYSVLSVERTSHDKNNAAPLETALYVYKTKSH